MRRILTFVFAVFMLVSLPAVAVAQQPAPLQQTQTKEQTVYVTKTGKKYHREGCRYLLQSKIPMKLEDAKAKGYEPCKVCHPPQ